MPGAAALMNHVAPSAEAPPQPHTLWEFLRDALHYWERRRLRYNLALLAVTLACLVPVWPHLRPVLNFENILALFILAVLANACYCAAYVVDIPLQFSSFASSWRKRRGLLWAAGTVFASAIAYYWLVDEIIPVSAR
jgi:hypothetical protein